MRAQLALLALLVACVEDPVEGTEPPTDTGTPIETEGVQTVSTSFDVDLYTAYPSPRIDRFDTLDGTRQLDAMIIEVDHTVEIDVALRNGGPMPVEADDYAYEVLLLSLVQLGETPENDGEEGVDSPPFFGPGGFGTGLIGVALAADDGDDSGGDDQHTETFVDHIVYEAPYDWAETPEFMEAMIGEDDIMTVVGGFSEEWFQWYDDLGPDAIMYARVDGMRYSGTITIRYEWSLVE